MNLTADEIRAMPAGKELNDRVHELVMGKCVHEWTITYDGPNASGALRYTLTCSKCKARRSLRNTRTPPPRDATPDYGGDVAAAWRVVEKITEPGNAASLTFTIAMDAVGDDLWCSTAQEAAFLICSVALIVTDLVATEED